MSRVLYLRKKSVADNPLKKKEGPGFNCRFFNFTSENSEILASNNFKKRSVLHFRQLRLLKEKKKVSLRNQQNFVLVHQESASRKKWARKTVEKGVPGVSNTTNSTQSKQFWNSNVELEQTFKTGKIAADCRTEDDEHRLLLVFQQWYYILIHERQGTKRTDLLTIQNAANYFLFRTEINWKHFTALELVE